MKRLRHPIRAIREPFGKAGLTVAIIALVFAMVGGAFAAGGLTKSQEKQVKKIAKKYAGKNGKNGALGPAGPAGAKGDTGATGLQGPEGPKGESGEAGMCSAANPVCQLATGATLKGAWGTSGGESEVSGTTSQDRSLVSISFPVEVSPAPTTLYPYPLGGGLIFGFELRNGETSIFGPYSEPETEQQAIEATEAYEAACPGSAADPEAAPGFLCVYPGEREGTINPPTGNESMLEAANTFGIVLPFKIGNNASQRGSWAVTAS